MLISLCAFCFQQKPLMFRAPLIAGQRTLGTDGAVTRYCQCRAVSSRVNVTKMEIP
jgi:hypothetical protein